MPVNQEKLAYRKANNLCPRDGRPNVPGRKLCEKCLKAAAVKTERYRQRKINASLCTNCGESAPVGSSRLCQICKEKASEYCHNSHIERYNKRKAIKQCTMCSNHAVDGKAACQKCLDKHSSLKKDKYHENALLSKCLQCGDNLGESKGKRCQTCIDRRNAWYQGSTTQTKDKVRRDENRAIVLAHYGGKCVKCNESKPTCLAIDHIEGGGNTHRKEIGKYGSGFFKWLIDNDFPEGFQILCHNCNMSKHLNGGICPHLRPSGLSNICRNTEPTQTYNG